ncbi:PTS transporter subunit EIIC [uncultured Clostridium sp.]|uniref:PTS transporter subunit EIIC n=1 Tax=uncultured Clostridium sp. TaxID=59620 RepID=UPI00272D0C15|nr:PTS transporter subunit EIIC [uncultured Clostridium sp.]
MGKVNNKKERYLNITNDIIKNVGGKENIKGLAHCATRLRIVLDDDSKINMEALDEIDMAKGVFMVGDQLQIIFGAGLVNEVYEVFAQYTNMQNMSLSDIKTKSAENQNIFQKIIKSISDVFIEIMPAILAAALLLGLSGLLGQEGIFGSKSVVEMWPWLEGINRFISIVSSSVFDILPLIVVYSATKRYGGRPVLGLVIGAIMLSTKLTDAYSAAQGTAVPEVINVLGLKIQLVGFQGGIIIAIMMGAVISYLDKFFEKSVPNSIKLLVSPMLTVFVSALLLFVIIGPIGRSLANLITTTLVWTTTNLGIFGYIVFAGFHQIIVITGLHHIFGAIESQLLVDTGVNFLNPIFSVAVVAQGGAVLGYLILHWSNVKAREMCIPAFTSTLFGISEPAVFGVTLRNKYPLICGCIASALAGGYIYISKLTAIGFGTTGVPGFAIVNSANNGYINYVIAHLIALIGGLLMTVIWGKISIKNKN